MNHELCDLYTWFQLIMGTDKFRLILKISAVIIALMQLCIRYIVTFIYYSFLMIYLVWQKCQAKLLV